MKSGNEQSSASPKAAKNKVENKSPKKKVEEKIREPSEPSQHDLKKGPKGPHVPKEVAWPVKRFINPYGFIHLGSDVLAALHVPKSAKTDITLDLNEKGDLIVKIGEAEEKEG